MQHKAIRIFRNKKIVSVIIFVVLFAAIGCYLLFQSYAATLMPEDINKDGTVNLLDFSILSNDYNKTTGLNNPRSDINLDGIVNLLDFSLLASKFGTTYVIDPTPTPPPSGNPLTVKVLGNHLVDASGNVVQLRGVNRSGTQYACIEGWGIFDGPTDATALSAIKAWGANAVRVSLNETCWLGINGSPAQYSGTNYQTAIKDYVGRLNAQGLRVILDLHWSAPGTTKATDQLTMPSRDHAPAFWQSVAGVFKDNPSVVFDLYNEPFPDSNRNTTAAWTCVRDGGTCPGVSFTAAGSQEMLNAVRAAGAKNVVMVGGPQYAGVVDKWVTYKPNDPEGQLAASIHIYYDTPASPEWSPCYLQSCWNNSMAPLANTTPIVIGEVGEFDCNYGLIYGAALSPTQPSILDWADQHGISYFAWSWMANGGSNCTTEPALILDYNGTPTGYGTGIRNHLLSLPH